jgi:recombinational DNA repair protein (RecF pathway)
MGAVWVGAPGPGHRFGGAAEPMRWGSFLLYQGPRRLYLKGADVAEDFLSVRGSKPRLTCAARWLRELADRLPLGHENDGVLSLLWGCMKHLSRGASVPLLDARFAWRWGNVWGVAPSFDGCSECGAVFARGEPVFMTEWGFLCPRCGGSLRQKSGGAGYRKPVSPDAFEVLKTLCVSSADGFVRREPEAGASCAPGGPLEGWIKDAASWLFSFLRIV